MKTKANGSEYGSRLFSAAGAWGTMDYLMRRQNPNRLLRHYTAVLKKKIDNVTKGKLTGRQKALPKDSEITQQHVFS